MHSGSPGRTAAPTSITSLRPTEGSIASSAWLRPPPRDTTARPTSRAFMPRTWPDRSALQGLITGGAREIATAVLEEVVGPAQRRDHARELLRRAAVLQGGFGAGTAGSDARRKLAQRQHLARQRHHHLVQAWIARSLAVQVVDGLGDLERIADVAAQHAVHVGDQRHRRQARHGWRRRPGSAPGRGPSPRCRRRRRSRISRPSPARRGRPRSSCSGSSSRSAESIRRWR